MSIEYNEQPYCFCICENAEAVESVRGSAVAVHSRICLQMYEGKANWDMIHQMK